MGELGFPELTTKQIEILCQTAEDTARNYILTKVSSKDIDQINIAVEAEGAKPISITVEIDLLLSKQSKEINTESLVKNAVKEAHKAAENYLRKIK
jgi:transcription antitermination factor NusA-like protein